jgi:CheY-like chemotaxis protein
VKTVVAYVPDLMDRSKVSGAPANVTFVNRPADLADAVQSHRPDLVVVDLTRPGVAEVLGRLSVPVIGFANHINREAMDAALAAGATQVMARSAFFGRLDELLGD